MRVVAVQQPPGDNRPECTNTTNTDTAPSVQLRLNLGDEGFILQKPEVD